MYAASHRVQITEPGEPSSTLKMHEARIDDGKPLCGTPARAWKGIQLVYAPPGSGQVTCGLCARTRRS